MLGNGGSTEVGGDRAQFVVAHERTWQGEPSECQRIDDANTRPRVRTRAGRTTEEAHVKGRVMRDEDGGALRAKA